ncbi:MAG: N-acetylmuramoyl-L-alanine amidase [Vampirovibrionales bacterium]|nr:N-acetylmuramoyl-L-alanine amidase [Vampirovibrionales bacterium]
MTHLKRRLSGFSIIAGVLLSGFSQTTFISPTFAQTATSTKPYSVELAQAPVASALEAGPSGQEPVNEGSYGPLRSIYVRDGVLVIEGPQPKASAVLPDAQMLSVKQQFLLASPDRYVLDLHLPQKQGSTASGAAADKTPESTDKNPLLTPITLQDAPGYSWASQVRIGRFDENTIRVVIESPTPKALLARINPVTNTITVPLVSSLYSYAQRAASAEANSLPLLQGVTLEAGPLPKLQLKTSRPVAASEIESRVIPWASEDKLDGDKALMITISNVQIPETGFAVEGSMQPWGNRLHVLPFGPNSKNIRIVVPLSVPAAAEQSLSIDKATFNNGLLTVIALNGAVPGNMPQVGQLIHEITLNGKTQPTLQPPVAGSKLPFPARVVIDAGHGGKDHGAIRGDVKEKDLNLRMALWLRDVLRAQGVTVYMTRENDTFVPLPEITRITNAIKPDLFVSIHHNANNNSAIAGLETYFYNYNSKPFADRVHKYIVGATGANDRGVRRAMFYVIHHTSVPAILCEVGYVSNPNERAALAASDRPKRAVSGIAQGVVDYLNTMALARAKR